MSLLRNRPKARGAFKTNTFTTARRCGGPTSADGISRPGEGVHSSGTVPDVVWNNQQPRVMGGGGEGGKEGERREGGRQGG